jgi:hypothetical protein
MSSKLGAKGYQKKQNFTLISKMCRSLASRSSQRFFSKISSKLGANGYQKKQNFTLISKMCRSLAPRSSQRFFFSENSDFL